MNPTKELSPTISIRDVRLARPDLFLTVYSGIFLQNRELRDHTGGVAPGAVSPQGADGSTC